jgi:carbamoyl-phosphate synthase large subunit
MIIGSGPIIIGQACEFDYSGTQACKALRALGYQIVLVNSNPATIMTDPGMADATYIEPLNLETLTRSSKKNGPMPCCPTWAARRG